MAVTFMQFVLVIACLMKEVEDKYCKELMKQIGSKIKEMRKHSGFSNYENFAFEHDLNRVHYGRMETGTNFTFKSLVKILEIHKISPEDFFKGIK